MVYRVGHQEAISQFKPTDEMFRPKNAKMSRNEKKFFNGYNSDSEQTWSLNSSGEDGVIFPTIRRMEAPQAEGDNYVRAILYDTTDVTL